jgi:ribonuclease HI
MADKQEIIIYTDGASLGNPGPGGYGIVIIDGKQRRELSGGYRNTTNNRMELLATIEALQTLKKPSKVILYSDSRYVVDAINKGWAVRWRAKGWKRNKREKALNPDLWEILLKLITKHEVTFQWLRGHAGHKENECADRLAVLAAKKKDLPPDQGYEDPPRNETQPSLL